MSSIRDTSEIRTVLATIAEIMAIYHDELRKVGMDPDTTSEMVKSFSAILLTQCVASWKGPKIPE